jgi:hypothetical protein
MTDCSSKPVDVTVEAGYSFFCHVRAVITAAARGSG